MVEDSEQKEVRGGVGRRHHQRPIEGKRYSPPRGRSMASPVAALKSNYAFDGTALAT